MKRDWDAGTYHRVSTDVHTDWAAKVLDRLPLSGTETVLDAGCGSGSVTVLLAERCAHVIAVDASPSMVEHARRTLGARATVLQQDLLELALDEPVDAAFSSAVFHWVPDHRRLFRRLHEAVKPGAPLEAQYGGHGNVRQFLEAAIAAADDERFREHLGGWTGPWNFTKPEQAEEWLAAAGFTDVRAWLETWPMTPSEPREYIRSVCLGHHLEALPEELRGPFVDAVAERMPAEIDYVRLNISARRAA